MTPELNCGCYQELRLGESVKSEALSLCGDYKKRISGCKVPLR